jgi:uncharacterized paraquat-inducible protein A
MVVRNRECYILKTIIEATDTDPKHEVELLCSACSYDLDESEIAADTCADCGTKLNLRQNTTIHVTSIPMLGITEV